jgi:hypothetical protein
MLADEKINVIPILKNKATGRYLSCLRSATSLPLDMLQSLFELVYWYEDITFTVDVGSTSLLFRNFDKAIDSLCFQLA